MNTLNSARSAPVPSREGHSGRHRTPEERRHWIELYERSGHTLKRFCAENGLAISTLLLWRRQVREGRVVSTVRSRLVEVPMSVAMQASSAVSVHLPRGVRLEVQPGIDPLWLAQLLGRLCLPD